MTLTLSAWLRRFFRRRPPTLHDALFGRLILDATPYAGAVWRNDRCPLAGGVTVPLSIDADAAGPTTRQRQVFTDLRERFRSLPSQSTSDFLPGLQVWLDERFEEAVAHSARGIAADAPPWKSAEDMLRALRLAEIHLFADDHPAADAWLSFAVLRPDANPDDSGDSPLLWLEWRDAAVIHLQVE